MTTYIGQRHDGHAIVSVVDDRTRCASMLDPGSFNQSAGTALKTGLACISGKHVDKTCAEMTDRELADFLEQGAWRTNRQESDVTAYEEAARRLRKRGR
jgi:hypothetical protein